MRECLRLTEVAIVYNSILGIIPILVGIVQIRLQSLNGLLPSLICRNHGDVQTVFVADECTAVVQYFVMGYVNRVNINHFTIFVHGSLCTL